MLGDAKQVRVDPPPPFKQAISWAELCNEPKHTPTPGTTHRNLLLHNRLNWVDTTASERVTAAVTEKDHQHEHVSIQTDHTHNKNSYSNLRQHTSENQEIWYFLIRNHNDVYVHEWIFEAQKPSSYIFTRLKLILRNYSPLIIISLNTNVPLYAPPGGGRLQPTRLRLIHLVLRKNYTFIITNTSYSKKMEIQMINRRVSAQDWFQDRFK